MKDDINYNNQHILSTSSEKAVCLEITEKCTWNIVRKQINLFVCTKCAETIELSENIHYKERRKKYKQKSKTMIEKLNIRKPEKNAQELQNWGRMIIFIPCNERNEGRQRKRKWVNC